MHIYIKKVSSAWIRSLRRKGGEGIWQASQDYWSQDTNFCPTHLSQMIIGITYNKLRKQKQNFAQLLELCNTERRAIHRLWSRILPLQLPWEVVTRCRRVWKTIHSVYYIILTGYRNCGWHIVVCSWRFLDQELFIIMRVKADEEVVAFAVICLGLVCWSSCVHTTTASEVYYRVCIYIRMDSLCNLVTWSQWA